MHEGRGMRRRISPRGAGGGWSLKSVPRKSRCFLARARVLYTKRPHTSLGKQTLNISVRTLLHKTPTRRKRIITRAY